jgi:hypothetical protein
MKTEFKKHLIVSSICTDVHKYMLRIYCGEIFDVAEWVENM